MTSRERPSINRTSLPSCFGRLFVLSGQLRILEDGALVAVHPILEGQNQRWLDPSHRTARKTPRTAVRQTPVARRPLDFYANVGQRLAAPGAGS